MAFLSVLGSALANALGNRNKNSKVNPMPPVRMQGMPDNTFPTNNVQIPAGMRNARPVPVQAPRGTPPSRQPLQRTVMATPAFSSPNSAVVPRPQSPLNAQTMTLLGMVNPLQIENPNPYPGPQQVGNLLAEALQPRIDFAQNNLEALLAQRDGMEEGILNDLENQKAELRDNLQMAYAPRFGQIDQEGEQGIQTTRRSASAAGSARSSAATKLEGQVINNTNQRRDALEAQRRIEEMRMIAELEGASEGELNGLDNMIRAAQDNVFQLGEQAALLNAGLQEELIKQQESARQFDLEFMNKSRDSLVGAMSGIADTDTNQSRLGLERDRLLLEGELGIGNLLLDQGKLGLDVQKFDQQTQENLANLALQVPEGETMQVGDYTVRGMYSPTPDYTALEFTDDAGNVNIVAFDKLTGEVVVRPVGALGRVTPEPRSYGGGGYGGYGGYGGGSEDPSELGGGFLDGLKWAGRGTATAVLGSRGGMAPAVAAGAGMFGMGAKSLLDALRSSSTSKKKTSSSSKTKSSIF